MKQFSRSSLYFILSLLFHITLLLYIPTLTLPQKPNIQKTIDIDLIKLEPSKKAVNIQKVIVKQKSNIAPLNSPNDIVKSKITAGMKKPEIDIPIAKTDEKVFLPENVKDNKKTDETLNKKTTNVNVGTEISKVEKDIASDSSTSKGKKTEDSSGLSSDFFTIKNNSAKPRGIIKTPPKPVFALENDTKIKLKFSIDKNGNTFNIILLTKSNPAIEKIAIEYVSRIRFEAVSYTSMDSAEITIYFKVRQ